MQIDIYRGVAVTATATIDSGTVFSAQVNGEDKITAVFKSPTPLNLMLRDYIVHKGLKYQILNFIDVDIDHEYTYGATLMGTSYSLFNKPFLSATNASTFSLTGTATSLLTQLITRINTVDSGWTIGTVYEVGTVKTIDFAGDDCRSALGKIFRAFNLEVSYVVKQISLTQRFELVNSAIPLAYGQNKGLYSLSKRVEGSFFTRAVGFGSTRNIPVNYRGGLERLTFTPGYVDIADAASFGTPIEQEVEFNDIYPHRTGTLTGAGTTTADGQTISDTTIDFNLADNFITGKTPKIVMISGNWTSSEFDIIDNSYVHATKTFKIRPNKEGGFYFPNSTSPLAAGDQYTFIGINLPNSYVLAAEAELAAATAGYAATKPLLDVSYGLVIDPIHVLNNNLTPLLNLGQKILITNSPTGINANMRITSISYPLIAPHQVTATISDKVQYSEEQQITRIVIEGAKAAMAIKENIAEVKAFTSRRLDENLNMVFDPAGNYYSGKIKPLSIETLQLAVGSRTQQFTLSVLMQAQYAGNPNAFGFSAGQLVHYTVVPGSTYTWEIPSGLITPLTPATGYYIYARCNKGNNVGVIVLDTVARQIESDSTYYYFLIGRLNSEDGGVRAISKSYGISTTNGKFIDGTLTSTDGLSYIDLNVGLIRGRMEFLKADASGYDTVLSVDVKAKAAFATATDAKTKTDLLKSLAYEDLVEAAKLGSTVIQGGYIKTNLIDVDYIKANFINAAYIATLEIAAVKGTIGGNTINSTGIVGTKFSIVNGVFSAADATISGTITATAGSIGGNLITINGIVGDKFSIINGVLTAQDATFVNASVTGSFTSVNAKATINGTKISFSDGAVEALMTSSLTDYLGDPIGCGFKVGNVVMYNAGIYGIGFALGQDAVRVGSLTSGNMIMNSLGFSINDGAKVSRSATIVVGSDTYNFVNGLLVV